MKLPKLPKIEKYKPLDEMTGGGKKTVKAILIGVLAILFGALGLTVFNTDFDLGKILSGNSITESRMATDKDGNVIYDKFVKRDANGKLLPESCQKDLYNCANFKNQPQAQEISDECKSIAGNDINNLDGDHDGIACEDLPKGK